MPHLLAAFLAMWAEAETGVQRFVRLSMYVLTPHNFVALSSAKATATAARGD